MKNLIVAATFVIVVHIVYEYIKSIIEDTRELIRMIKKEKHDEAD